MIVMKIQTEDDHSMRIYLKQARGTSMTMRRNIVTVSFGGDAGETFAKGWPCRGDVRRQQGRSPSGSIGMQRREDASGNSLGERKGIF